MSMCSSMSFFFFFFFSSRRRHTRLQGDWSSDVCSSDLVFLFASETETQGLVLAEAAACGLPAVAVSAPGCEEVVRDGETGVLTKGDPMALGDAVIGLLLDAARRAVMSLRARQTAERLFDVRLMIERT